MADIERPDLINQLCQQCEANQVSFDNSDMSAALWFGSMLWREIDTLARFYERAAIGNEQLSESLSIVVKDMRRVLRDTKKSIDRKN